LLTPFSHVEEAVHEKSNMPRAIPIYTPPDGFAMISESNGGKQEVAQVFSPSSLAGKQLWYITAPASVPIGVVKQVSLRDVQLGRPALSLNGRDYGFAQEQTGDRGNTKVLIPDGKSTLYRVGKRLDI
jgi:DNA-directed RNA polymerase I subunit RPA34.5